MNRYRGFLAMESLILLLIIVVMLADVLYTVREATERSDRYYKDQSRFDKVVSVADYLVKSGAVVEDRDKSYPNWIDEKRLGAIDWKALAARIGLERVQAGWEPQGGTCVFRLVVTGSQRDIRKLYVCGE